MTSVTSRTQVLALLGDPVDHSLSPVIQNAAFREAGVDGVYVALRCEAPDLVGFMHGLGRAGGGGNITLPYKQKAASFLDERSEAVRRTGACNTFWGRDGKVCGDNTDVEGFRRALKHFLGRSSEGFRVLLLGAGGAARAARTLNGRRGPGGADPERPARPGRRGPGGLISQAMISPSDDE